MALLIGFLVGAASGDVQFWLLSKYTKSITGGTFGIKTVLAGILQLFLPLVVLLGCAFLFRDSLLLTGMGMAAALLGCAAARFIFYNRRSKKR